MNNTERRKDVLMLQEHLSVCQEMLDKGDVEGVKLYLGYKEGQERHIESGLPFSQQLWNWIEGTDGYFTLEEVYRSFELRTKKEKLRARRELHKLKEKGEILKHGSRDGEYRKLTNALEEMGWKDASVIPLDIDFPLNIGGFFQAYPKNMGVIAGAKDSGKTATLLEFVKRNMEKWDIHFYTNEMGKEELKHRIMKREDIRVQDWNFHAYECTEHYEDHIARYPDSIHVVDYIEVNDAFYRVGDYLKWMHEALGQGFIFLGLQKDWGAPLGRGAAFSLQRPRLYITMERGVARVVSAKNRTPTCEHSPVGNILYYGLVDGWKLVAKGIWHPEMPGEIDEYLGIKKGVYGGYQYGDKQSY